MKLSTKFFLAISIAGIAYFYHILTKPLPVPDLDYNEYWGRGDGIQYRVDTAIKPQEIYYEEATINNLRSRLNESIKFHAPLEGINHEYGLNANKMVSFVKYWKDDYMNRWPERLAFLNSIPHFLTEIQGLKIHFLHAKPNNPEGKRVVPLLLLHGWPGSVREFYDFIPLLTNPNEDSPVAFEVIAPSLPGYGWSEGASKTGFGPAQVANVMRNLMLRIGHKKFAIQGGDWGSIIGSNIATLFPQNVVAYHMLRVPSSRKRTRKSQLNNASPKKQKLYDEDDDGSTCPICLDIWDNDGGHRLVSLKCGHLFGESCIKRWIVENVKCCPTCKKKATKNDIRSIYANRVTAMDTTEIVKYKKLLEKEEGINKKQKEEIDSLRFQLKLQRDLVLKIEKEMDELKKSAVNLSKAVTSLTTKPKTYKLFMEKNIEITKDGGCKVMIHGKRVKSLMISQKSTQSLFPGYGIRFIDSTTFRPSNEFLHTSSKQIRDITLDRDEEHLLTTSLEKGAKLFNLQQRRVVSIFAPEDKAFWAAAFDCERPKYIYLGAERGGSTYIYDTRNPQSFVHELKVEDDMSPVIKICPITARDDFPFGGFFVCKLNSVWFYEFDASQQTIGTKLAVDGPFVSMNYEQETQHILISARPNNQKKYRYIVAELMKVEDATHIHIWGTCLGSTVQSLMRRSTQIRIDAKNSIVAAYLEDVKSLCTWSAPSCTRMVSASLTDPVVDLCPIYTNANPYLTALSDSKCRVYKLEVTEN